MLADLGQKGGMLKLVGKIALLWGGLRGAMSLTDKLIQFLHIAERPLIQRYFVSCLQNNHIQVNSNYLYLKVIWATNFYV